MSEITTLYIVRHGQTEWNIEHRLQGHQDSPLTELGIEQAQWLADALQDEVIDYVYSSSSPRAVKTAEIITANRDLPIIACDELMEMSLGSWEGLTQEEAKLDQPEQFQYFWTDPAQFYVTGSETYQEVSQRAVSKVKALLAAHRGKRILLVTHTVVVKLLMAHFEQRPLQALWQLPYIYPASLCQVEIEGEQANIVLHADISHYKGEPSDS